MGQIDNTSTPVATDRPPRHVSVRQTGRYRKNLKVDLLIAGFSADVHVMSSLLALQHCSQSE